MPADGRRRLGYGLMDLFVIATCTLVFVVAIGAGKHIGRKDPPIDSIARDLGTTPEQLRQAADRFLPRFTPGPPTENQRRRLAMTLDVSVDQLDAVMERYRPDPLRPQ